MKESTTLKLPIAGNGLSSSEWPRAKDPSTPPPPGRLGVGASFHMQSGFLLVHGVANLGDDACGAKGFDRGDLVARAHKVVGKNGVEAQGFYYPREGDRVLSLNYISFKPPGNWLDVDPPTEAKSWNVDGRKMLWKEYFEKLWIRAVEQTALVHPSYLEMERAVTGWLGTSWEPYGVSISWNSLDTLAANPEGPVGTEEAEGEEPKLRDPLKTSNLFSGFGLCVDGRNWGLTHVEPDSVAARLGIQAGSTIVKVQGEPVARRTIRSFLSKMGGAEELSLAILNNEAGKITGYNVVMKVADIGISQVPGAGQGPGGGGQSKQLLSAQGAMPVTALRSSASGAEGQDNSGKMLNSENPSPEANDEDTRFPSPPTEDGAEAIGAHQSVDGEPEALAEPEDPTVTFGKRAMETPRKDTPEKPQRWTVRTPPAGSKNARLWDQDSGRDPSVATPRDNLFSPPRDTREKQNQDGASDQTKRKSIKEEPAASHEAAQPQSETQSWPDALVHQSKPVAVGKASKTKLQKPKNGKKAARIQGKGIADSSHSEADPTPPNQRAPDSSATTTNTENTEVEAKSEIQTGKPSNPLSTPSQNGAHRGIRTPLAEQHSGHQQAAIEESQEKLRQSVMRASLLQADLLESLSTLAPASPSFSNTQKTLSESPRILDPANLSFDTTTQNDSMEDLLEMLTTSVKKGATVVEAHKRKTEELQAELASIRAHQAAGQDSSNVLEALQALSLITTHLPKKDDGELEMPELQKALETVRHALGSASHEVQENGLSTFPRRKTVEDGISFLNAACQTGHENGGEDLLMEGNPEGHQERRDKGAFFGEVQKLQSSLIEVEKERDALKRQLLARPGVGVGAAVEELAELRKRMQDREAQLALRTPDRTPMKRLVTTVDEEDDGPPLPTITQDEAAELMEFMAEISGSLDTLEELLQVVLMSEVRIREEMKVERDEMKVERDQMKVNLDQMQAGRELMVAEMESLRGQNGELKNQLQTLQHQHDSQVLSSPNREAPATSAEFEKLQSDLAATLAEKDSLLALKDRLECEKEALTQRVTKLEKERENQPEEESHLQQSEVSRMVSEAQLQAQEARQQESRAMSELEEARAKQHIQFEEIEGLKASLTEKTEEMDGLRAALEQVQSDKTETELALDDQREKERQTLKMLTQAQTELASLRRGGASATAVAASGPLAPRALSTSKTSPSSKSPWSDNEGAGPSQTDISNEDLMAKLEKAWEEGKQAAERRLEFERKQLAEEWKRLNSKKKDSKSLLKAISERKVW